MSKLAPESSTLQMALKFHENRKRIEDILDRINASSQKIQKILVSPLRHSAFKLTFYDNREEVSDNDATLVDEEAK